MNYRIGLKQTFQLQQFRNGQILEKEMLFKGCTELSEELEDLDNSI